MNQETWKRLVEGESRYASATLMCRVGCCLAGLVAILSMANGWGVASGMGQFAALMMAAGMASSRKRNDLEAELLRCFRDQASRGGVER